MKKLIRKTLFAMIALIAGVGLVSETALAAGSFNPQPSPWGTGILSAAIEPTNTIGTSDVASATSGDVVALNIYYHNNGNQTINNVRIKFSPASTGSSTSHTFTGTISGDGVSSIVDTTRVNVSSAQTLTFIPGSVRWFPNQSGQTNTSGQTISSSQESDLVGGSGLNIGSLTAGWPSQGGIVAKFQVSSNGGNNGGNNQGQVPTVSTTLVSRLSNATGNVTLNGYFNANGSATTTSFRYRIAGNGVYSGAWMTVGETSRGISSGTISYALTGLAQNTYEYQAVATNASGTVYGNSVQFSIINDIVNPNPGQSPTVDTTNPSVDNNSGDVTLRGTYNSNGYTTTTYFQYRKVNGAWITVGSQNQGISSGNISTTIYGLSDGDYEYQAIASNTYGTNNGGIVDFTIDRDNSCSNCDDLTITTEPAEDIDEDSAVLVGEIDDIGAGDVTRWFEYDTNRNDVSDGDGTRVSISGSTNSRGEFSKRISGLQEGRTYYFRACGEDDNGDEDCGSVKSFTTDDESIRRSDSDLPTVTTLGTLSVGSTVASVDAYFNANGCSVSTYYQYGRTAGLGSKTGTVFRGTTSGSMAYSFTALSPNTTYYYRAVGTNCEGTSVGAIRSFTTANQTVINPPVVINTGGNGGGSSFIKLMIDNNRDIVRDGREVVYDVSWENISNRDLTDLVLEVNLPEEMTVIDTDKGSITRNQNVVIVEISRLDRRASGEMSLVAEVTGSLRDGDPVVAQAIIAFENPTTNATENAIAYDSDEFLSDDSSVLGASLFGAGFLPTSLGGWLLILLIILLIIVLVRQFMRKNQVNVNTQVNPQVPPQPGAAPSQDYVVYRPTPKQ